MADAEKTPTTSSWRWEAFGIVRPRTPAAALAIETYLRQGNGTDGKTERERIDILKRYQTMYLERSVRHIHDDRIGRVLWLVPRQPRDIRNLKQAGKTPIEPFRAHVAWSGKSIGQVSLLDLKFFDQ